MFLEFRIGELLGILLEYKFSHLTRNQQYLIPSSDKEEFDDF